MKLIILQETTPSIDEFDLVLERNLNPWSNIHQILFKPVTKYQILNLSRKLTSWSHLTPREQKLTAITAFTAKRVVKNNKKRQEHEEHNQEMIRSQTFMHQKNHDEENIDKETQ